jgi:hypothetical protein
LKLNAICLSIILNNFTLLNAILRLNIITQGSHSAECHSARYHCTLSVAILNGIRISAILLNVIALLKSVKMPMTPFHQFFLLTFNRKRSHLLMSELLQRFSKIAPK